MLIITRFDFCKKCRILDNKSWKINQHFLIREIAEKGGKWQTIKNELSGA